jgi:mono/diheme cytochrome c family protein
MNDRQRPLIGLVAVLGLAAPAPGVIPAPVAQETAIQLPPDNPLSQLKAGAGSEAARRHCAVCHSTDYIVRQPRFDAGRWDAEVKKMITVYGARISDADAKIIADYLAGNYGVERQKPPPAK